jgi:hypothetical protein
VTNKGISLWLAILMLYDETERTCSTERNISAQVQYRIRTAGTKKEPWPKFKNTGK